MNLLITNSQLHQAYVIVRSLRPHAHKIAATIYGRNRFIGPASTAACSRMVDTRHRVPSPQKDWLAGRLQTENTDREEAYVSSMLEICEQEGIDVVFPSYDPEVYVLSKNKARFAARDILLPIPDFTILRTALDKYLSVKAAERAGFAVPQTFLPENEEEIRKIAASLPGPWVIRPRLTAGSKGMEIATTTEELLRHARKVRAAHAQPMIQEYVPGNQKQNFYLVVDRDRDLVSFFCPRSLRCVHRYYRDSTQAAESRWEHEYRPQVEELVREVGMWGGFTVQTKIDARDGTPKLMEINPRLGTHLWYRTELGINEPLMLLDIARGKKPKPVRDKPDGTLLLEPMEDVLGMGFELIDLVLHTCRRAFGRKLPVDAQHRPLSLDELCGFLWRLYTSDQEKVYSPVFRYLRQDPLSGLILCHGIIKYSCKGIRCLGR